MTNKAVIDAQVLFYFHYRSEKVPEILKQLKIDVILGKITVIIPTIAIAELLWKIRRENKSTESLKTAVKRWEQSPNVIIDSFDLNLIKLMLHNHESHELHDEIIAITCKKYDTNVVYGTDLKFETVFNLKLRSWK
ncbi:MAG: type II toxin-antitoxin system VapC family toxin [Promethearchaeota archaeon]|nr:MAG: type II toxin-antitoxin system VapC family toxin [Candidatus Lokiarchaeota archaeon]